jgi:hypothetical protein
MSDPKDPKSIENLKNDAVNGENIKGGGIAPPVGKPVDTSAPTIEDPQPDLITPDDKITKDPQVIKPDDFIKGM